jgi:hypothetical protein
LFWLESVLVLRKRENFFFFYFRESPEAFAKYFVFRFAGSTKNCNANGLSTIFLFEPPHSSKLSPHLNKIRRSGTPPILPKPPACNNFLQNSSRNLPAQKSLHPPKPANSSPAQDFPLPNRKNPHPHFKSRLKNLSKTPISPPNFNYSRCFKYSRYLDYFGYFDYFNFSLHFDYFRYFDYS